MPSTRCDTTHFDSDDDYRTGCGNVRTTFTKTIKAETHKGLKRVTLRCLICPMLVIIHFLEREEEITEQSNFVNNVTWFYFSFPRPLKKWPTNGGNIFIQNPKSLSFKAIWKTLSLSWIR